MEKDVIKFRKKADKLMEALTAKGRTISFYVCREMALKFAEESALSAEEQGATKLVFYTNFHISMPMMDFILDYKILTDLELTNYGKQFAGYPINDFSYENLQNLFTDLTIEFEL